MFGAKLCRPRTRYEREVDEPPPKALAPTSYIGQNAAKVTGNDVLYSNTFKVGPLIQLYKSQKGKL